MKQLVFCLALAALSWPALADSSNSYSVGVQGFRDHYSEPEATVDEHANFGAVTAGYAHTFDNNMFGAVDGRASYGRDNYKSADGTLDGIPEYEFEGRLRGGKSVPFAHGLLDLYTGVFCNSTSRWA